MKRLLCRGVRMESAAPVARAARHARAAMIAGAVMAAWLFSSSLLYAQAPAAQPPEAQTSAPATNPAPPASPEPNVAVPAPSAGACEVPSDLMILDSHLDRVKAAIKSNQRLDILVVGSASSTLPGNENVALAYPARLESIIKSRVPTLAVSVTPQILLRRNTKDVAMQLKSLISDKKPTLVIWQTGTVDAMRNVDPDVFREALAGGVDAVRAANADVVLMNMQYSPRTETVLALNTYMDVMRLVSQQMDVPLFDRFGIMRYWADTRQFDLYARARGMNLARRVHECIARALATFIFQAADVQMRDGKVQN